MQLKARDERVHQKTTHPLQELQNILPNNFQGTKSFFGYYQYDTLGHFIDQHENIWCYDDAIHRFDVFNKRKKFQYSVSAKMKAEEPQAPKNKGCGNWQDVDNGPQILSNPGAPAQQPGNLLRSILMCSPAFVYASLTFDRYVVATSADRLRNS